MSTETKVHPHTGVPYSENGKKQAFHLLHETLSEDGRHLAHREGAMARQHKNNMLICSKPGSTKTTRAFGKLLAGDSKKCTTRATVKLRERTSIGTWNVRTLYQSCKVKELIHEQGTVQVDHSGADRGQRRQQLTKAS